jgi:hypothetical protein
MQTNKPLQTTLHKLVTYKEKNDFNRHIFNLLKSHNSLTDYEILIFFEELSELYYILDVINDFDSCFERFSKFFKTSKHQLILINILKYIRFYDLADNYEILSKDSDGKEIVLSVNNGNTFTATGRINYDRLMKSYTELRISNLSMIDRENVGITEFRIDYIKDHIYYLQTINEILDFLTLAKDNCLYHKGKNHEESYYDKDNNCVNVKFINYCDDMIREETEAYEDSLEVGRQAQYDDTCGIVGVKTKSPKVLNHGLKIEYTDEQLSLLCQKLIENKFLCANTNENHFINAFNGKELIDYKPFEWRQSLFLALFLKVNFDTDDKRLKVWHNAERIFNNGKAVSLRNADKRVKTDGLSDNRSDKHQKYFNILSEIMRSLQ